MTYATYITDALVCGVKNSNTSDRSYLLFTREAGMLFATARSVREERSRQRYALQEFSEVRVSLIKGKSGWRIGSVEALRNYYHKAKDKETRGSIVTVFRDLRRFIHGEEVSRVLYDLVVDSLQYAIQPIATDKRTIIDKIVKARLLHSLGYISNQALPAKLLSGALGETEMSVDVHIERKLDQVLDTAITASHL